MNSDTGECLRAIARAIDKIALSKDERLKLTRRIAYLFITFGLVKEGKCQPVEIKAQSIAINRQWAIRMVDLADWLEQIDNPRIQREMPQILDLLDDGLTGIAIMAVTD